MDKNERKTMITKEETKFLNRINSGSQKVKLGDLLLELESNISELAKVVETLKNKVDKLDGAKTKGK